MVKKCPICNKPLDSLMPFKCRRCNRYFCHKHRLPENHSCRGLYHKKKSMESWSAEEKKFKDDSFIKERHEVPFVVKTDHPNKIVEQKKKDKVSRYQPYGPSKKPLYKHKNKYIRWFFRKKYPHSRIRKRDLYRQIGYVILFSFLFWIAYANAYMLNDITVVFINLGAIILIILFLYLIWNLYKLLKNIRYGLRGLSHGFKLIGSLIVLGLFISFLTNPLIVTSPIEDFDYAVFNPLNEDWEPGEGGIQSPLKPNIDIYQLALEVHRLVNIERQEYGLSSLVWDEELHQIALSHSQDMARRNYFEHNTPEGKTPTDRAREAGYPVIKDYGYYYQEGIGENIMLTHTYSSVTYINGIPIHDWNDQSELAHETVQGWMNSYGHRQNILSGDYDKEGIGVAFGSDDQVYITQDFW